MQDKKPQWPAHFSGQDIALIERIAAWIDERGYSRAALARLARISGSAMTQILGGTYGTSPTKLLASVESAMRNRDESTGHAVAPVETSVFKLVNIACDMARRYRNFSVASGRVGTGKTFALKTYARTHPNTHFIEAAPTMNNASLVKQLYQMIIGSAKGSIADRFDELVTTLKNTDSLLIIDEAETMSASQLHTIRRLRDLANIGVVLAGTEHLHGLIKPHYGQFDQIRSRTGFWPETVKGITAEDAAALAQAAFGAEEVPEDVVVRLFAYSKGSARMLVEGLIAGIKEFRKDRPLDVKLVDAVAKQILCLQSLA